MNTGKLPPEGSPERLRAIEDYKAGKATDMAEFELAKKIGLKIYYE